MSRERYAGGLVLIVELPHDIARALTDHSDRDITRRALEAQAVDWIPGTAFDAEAGWHGHAVAEGGRFLGAIAGRFAAQALHPGSEDGARGGEEPGCVQDLVGVGAADAVDRARVGEGALQGVVFGGERRSEGKQVGRKDFDAAGILRSAGPGCLPRCAAMRGGRQSPSGDHEVEY